MRRRWLQVLARAGVLVLITACADAAGPQAPTVAGTWLGTSSSGAVFQLELTETAGTVTGNADMELAGNTFTFAVSGNRDDRAVTLTLTLEPFDAITIEGAVYTDVIEAQVAGAGFDEPLRLERATATVAAG